MLTLADLGHRVDAAGGDADGVEPFEPLVDVAGAEDLVQQRDQHRAVLDPLGLGVEAAVGHEVGPLEGRAALPPEPVVGHPEGEIGVGRLEDLVGHDRGMRVAAPARLLAGGEVQARLVGQQRRHHVEHRDLDLLATLGARAGQQREYDAVGGGHARDEVGDGRADLHRRAVGEPGDVHEPGFALDDQVVAAAPGLRAGLAEPRDRAIDQARVQAAQRRVADPELLHRARAEVLQQHVALGGQALEDGHARGRLEVEGEASLRAVHRHEVAGFAAHERWPLTGVVALAGLLDLDDRRPHVAQHHRGERARQHAREVEHAHAGERCVRTAALSSHWTFLSTSASPRCGSSR